ncbi:RsmB/NOP family class I SAM-dependent RNA methyltransferase [Shimia sediminis]|uniref:RsmB/NOP family class I SAM-dependent RNA methyltransferase n=1 Tax=Shimia sediminis TaxID=2497945 RepID=UPI000F8CAAA3|nr:RsmB/NOP family class I SAM-dependent RNA methyltransferase [Shimia sediminis]
MTPAARVQTAIELLQEVLGGLPAEKVLTAWARRSRFAGSKDRAAVRDHVFDVLRRRRSVLPTGLNENGRALMLGLLRQDGGDLDALFADLPYGPEAMSEIETEALSRPFPNQVDLPEWIVPRLEAALGDAFGAETTAIQHRAPVFLRANLGKGTRQQAQTALAAEGVVCESSPLADTAIVVQNGARRVAQTKAYREGLVEVQDASSQAAIAGLPLRDGMRVLDYCAGGGGKVLAMAARMKGQFVAHDANPQRLRDLPARAKRAGVRVDILSKEQLRREPGFDLVFCDVPCSGSGTWRRSPDAKWRFSESDLGALTKVQADILERCVSYVKQDGTLIYATCSQLREENEDQVARFLRDHGEFECNHMQRWYMQQGCDGFFIAHLTQR